VNVKTIPPASQEAAPDGAADARVKQLANTGTELRAIETAYTALSALGERGRWRAMRWIEDALRAQEQQDRGDEVPF
jgi:hypothetical protein